MLFDPNKNILVSWKVACALRKLKRHKLICFVSLVYLYLILVGCQAEGVNEPDSSNSDDREGIYQNIGLQAYDDMIDVTIVGQTSDSIRSLEEQFHNETLRNNRWTRLYRDTLGINVDYNWIVESSLYHQRLVNDIMSGTLPDMIKVDALQMRQLAEAGLIQDLTDVFEDYATPFTKEVLSQEVINPIEAALIDQKLMGVPIVESSLDRMQYLWIRTDWLENLNLDPPETMEDLLAISKAFTHDDPDQNGIDDTYGLAASGYLWNNMAGLEAIMAGFNAYPNIWLEDEDGQLVYGGIQPEIKAGLAVLQEMYQDGQIDEEFMFKDGNAVKEQVTNNEVGMIFGEQWASFYVQENFENNLEADWQPFPIVSATDQPVKMPIRNATSMFWVVKNDFDHPEALVKLINLHLEKNWGETADYEYYYSTPYPIWKLSPVTPFPVLKNLESYRQIEETRQTGLYSELYGEAKTINQQILLYEEEGNHTGWGWKRTYGSEGAYSILDDFLENDQIMYDKFVWPQTETMMEINTLLNNRQLDTYQRIILGEPISKFDDFIEEWSQIGGLKITGEVNDIYQQHSK